MPKFDAWTIIRAQARLKYPLSWRGRMESYGTKGSPPKGGHPEILWVVEAYQKPV